MDRLCIEFVKSIVSNDSIIVLTIYQWFCRSRTGFCKALQSERQDYESGVRVETREEFEGVHDGQSVQWSFLRGKAAFWESDVRIYSIFSYRKSLSD